MHECSAACVSLHHIHTIPVEVRRGHCIPWDLSFRWWKETMCILKSNLGHLQGQAILLTMKTFQNLNILTFFKKGIYIVVDYNFPIYQTSKDIFCENS